jgi:hypothetical protein
MNESNFYIKLRTEFGTVINIPIESDGIWTKCPICGKEHEVSLDTVIDPETLCLQLDSTVSCGDKKCEKEIRERYGLS